MLKCVKFYWVHLQHNIPIRFIIQQQKTFKKQSMKKSLLLRLVLVIVAIVGITFGANAQVTSSSMTGTVKDAKGALPGASVKATHTPTGTVYSVSTNNDGRFIINNMRVGGPYTIEISFVGYQPEKITDLSLKLGETFSLPITLSENGKQLQEVVVSGSKSTIMNSKRTGASTTVSKAQLENLPTISRSLQDFTRLTPQANGNSFAGSNNRYNSITIDGAVNNDVFGLAGTGTPGGQASTQPISLDAIQELQVVLAPFDVTQGNFTGGSVNAVTRSGSNKFEGSAYFFGRNQNTIGKSVDGLRTKAAQFYNTQYGFRLGGPIVKDKLFFFVNAESGRIQTPTTLNVGDPGSLLSSSDAQLITSTLQTRYGYDAGSYSSIDTKTQNNKILAKLDWNINSKNQLTLRHSYIDAFDDNISRSSTSFRFGNNAYKFDNTQNISVLELRSTISPSVSNNLIVGYSRIRDKRATAGSLFPQIQINNIGGISGNSATVGSERSSTANELDQDIFEFTDNLKIFANKHTFTIGTHNEFFKFRNLFINNFNGSYTYNSLADFVGGTVKPLTATATFSNVPGENSPAAKFSAAQLGFYFQDEIDAFEGFKLTAGLRVDVPLFFDDPAANPLVPTTFSGYKTDQTPSGQILVSPRVGFNWDLTGTRSIQMRGGIGLFTGRVPFVWLSNQYTNSGVLYQTVNATNSTGNFVADPTKQNGISPTPVATYEVDLLKQNYKLPQTMRYNLGLDFKIPGGVIATLEGLYSKTVNNVLYQNINLKPSTAKIDPSLSGGADTRELYTYSSNAGKVNPTFTNAILLNNTRKGYSYSLTGQLQKNWNFGLSSMFAYTYGKSTDINSGTSSTALSNYSFVQIVNNPNDPPLVYSNYDVRHRLVGSLSYGVRYGKNKAFGTSISIVYVGKSGTPFTYLYNGDLNGDGNTGNDLLYVPRNASEVKLVPFYSRNSSNQVVITPGSPTPAEQWTALNAFIESDPYLSKIRGQYTERNGARMPWEHQFDLSLLQDLGLVGKSNRNSIQLSINITNIGNLINKDWGKQYFLSNTSSTVVAYNTTQSSDRGFNFRTPTGGVVYGLSSFLSRWQGQVGVRYNFN